MRPKPYRKKWTEIYIVYMLALKYIKRCTILLIMTEMQIERKQLLYPSIRLAKI